MIVRDIEVYCAYRRFRVYVEVLNVVDWLGVDAPGVVEETDLRIGLAFSTGGFYGER